MEIENNIVQIRKVRDGWFSATDGKLFTVEGQDKVWVRQQAEHELQRRIDNGRLDRLFIITDENTQKSD